MSEPIKKIIKSTCSCGKIHHITIRYDDATNTFTSSKKILDDNNSVNNNNDTTGKEKVKKAFLDFSDEEDED